MDFWSSNSHSWENDASLDAVVVMVASELARMTGRQVTVKKSKQSFPRQLPEYLRCSSRVIGGAPEDTSQLRMARSA